MTAPDERPFPDPRNADEGTGPTAAPLPPLLPHLPKGSSVIPLKRHAGPDPEGAAPVDYGVVTHGALPPTGTAELMLRKRPEVLVHTRRERELAVSHWLLAAAPNMNEARTQWATRGIALLRCGGVFAAVRISAGIVQAAAGTEDPGRIGTYLREALQGPVFIDTSSRRYYVLVPVSASQLRQWHGHGPDVECLGPGSFLSVPRPQCSEPDVFRSYWCVPMDGPGTLCSPEAVLQVIAYGSYQRRVGKRLAAEADQDGHG
ncbi:hypothetical protein [Streptomyces sp. NPDC002785]|uniref:hypothetical protein n=1 Tax=Streptomyces sp. NPDC002785 TaxID=3154543 RepID=UPI00332C5B39